MPLTATRRCVFLDRDGVINAWAARPNGDTDSPAHPGEFHLLPRVGAAIRRLNEMPCLTIVVSNQPGVAKGKLDESMLEAITAKMIRELAAEGARLDGVSYCLHHPEGSVERYRVNCACRKPRPGLILDVARERGIDPSRAYMIGDSEKDIAAGRTSGCTTIWLGASWSAAHRDMLSHGITPDFVVADLWEAVERVRLREVPDATLH